MCRIFLLIVIFTTLFCFVSLGSHAQSDSRDENAEGIERNPETYLLPPDKKEKPKPVPYSTEEFAPWAYFTIRFAAVTVGSFPFAVLLGGIAFDSYKTAVESEKSGKFESKYLPLFFGGGEKPKYTSDEVGTLLLAAMGISLGVGVIDLIIGLVKHFRKQEINELFISTTN